MRKEENESSNLPVDVVNSIKKLKLIIKTIEANLYIPKEDILREVMQLLCSNELTHYLTSDEMRMLNDSNEEFTPMGYV